MKPNVVYRDSSKLLQNSLQMFENKIKQITYDNYVLYVPCRSIDKVTLKSSHTLTHFDRQFLFISGSLKNDAHTHVSHIKLQTSIMQG